MKVIKSLKNGKAPGDNMITAELLKVDMDFGATKMRELINIIWRQEKIPFSWKRGLIIQLSKKGNLKEWKNWRGITLLQVVSKILVRVVIDLIRNGIDSRLHKEQAGFTPGRGTEEQIFILHNILEQVNKCQALLYIHFVDFGKAFDSIHRKSLCMIMNQYGIQKNFKHNENTVQRF